MICFVFDVNGHFYHEQHNCFLARVSIGSCCWLLLRLVTPIWCLYAIFSGINFQPRSETRPSTYQQRPTNKTLLGLISSSPTRHYISTHLLIDFVPLFRRFRTCLKMADSSDASLVGNLFFNVVKTKCFVLKPEKYCKQYNFLKRKCEKKGIRKRAYLRDNREF